MADERYDAWLDDGWDDDDAEPVVVWRRVVLALGVLLAVLGLVLATSAVSNALVR